LAQALKQEMSARRAGGEQRVGVDRSVLTSDGLSEDTLDKVMFSWGMETDREGSRVHATGRIAVVSGLGPIHSLLTSDRSGSAVTTLGAVGLGGETGESLRPPQSRGDNPYWGGPTEIEAIELGVLHGVTWAGRANDGAAEQTVDCEIRDISAGGYRLSVEHPAGKGIQVGAILALRGEREESSRDVWRLGVVRWLRIGQGGAAFFGVQLLEGKPRPVTVERDRNESGVVDRWAGLLLRSSNEQPDRLLTPAFFATRDDSFAVVYKGRHVRVRLRQMVESTPAFSQYLFQAGKSRS